MIKNSSGTGYSSEQVSSFVFIYFLKESIGYTVVPL
jgi:hypothetical protein